MKKLLLLMIVSIAFLRLTAQNCEFEQITDKIVSCKCDFYEEHRAFYLISKDGLVLIDTYYYPWLTKESMELVCKAIDRNDFIYLLNTHGHGCHVGGNSLYKDIPIIGHDSVTSNVKKVRSYHLKEYNKIKEQALTDSSKTKELGELEMLVDIPIPTKTFSDSYSIDLTDLSIEMKYFGFSGHSNDEILVYIPQEKTLIIGQILGRSYFLPQVKENCTKLDLERKIDVLSYFISKELEHILSNHQGEINKEDLCFVRDYLQNLLSQIPSLVHQGKDLNDIKEALRLEFKFPEIAARHEISESVVKNHNANIESIWKMTNRIN